MAIAPPVSLAAPATSPHAELPSTTLIGQTHQQLRELAVAMGSPAFRGDQLHHWLYVKCVRSFDEMTDLSKPFRQALAENYAIGQLTLADCQLSSDGTRKYLFTLPDGNVVESVLMAFQERNTYALCVSTQVGCAMNCSFCATGKLGFTRHLNVGEIVEQYLFVQHHSGVEIRNVVFMGQGEPLHNYQPTVDALHLLNQSAEVGMRRMTVSTSGVVNHIDSLAAENLPITLAVSLHAADDATRDQIMPLNKKWPLAKLMPALHRYVEATHRRMTIEYILLTGVNDSLDQADKLVTLLKGLKCNINLIPYNPISTTLPQAVTYQRPSRDRLHAFMHRLLDSGKKVTIRLERGVDIDAACGQLANQHQPQPAVTLVTP